MRPILAIIFTVLLSSGYAQRKGNERGYWKEVKLGQVEILTPATIDKRLHNTVWCWAGGTTCYIKNGNLIEKRFLLNDVDSSNIPYIFILDIYIGDGKRIRYDFDIDAKTIQTPHSNEILFLNSNKPIYLCVQPLKTDGTPFSVYKFVSVGVEFIEKAEWKYLKSQCFNVLSRLDNSNFNIFHQPICPAPQNPDKRAELPFPDVKPKRHRRTMW